MWCVLFLFFFKQKTAYEMRISDWSSDVCSSDLLYVTLRKQITQRSLLVLFTNFERLSSMKRQLPYLKGLARHHLLLTVFFENTELKDLLDTHTRDTDAIYLKTTFEKLASAKRQVFRELNLHGLTALITTPADLPHTPQH